MFTQFFSVCQRILWSLHSKPDEWICRVRSNFAATGSIQLSRNWIKMPCRWFDCQIPLPGHFLWGNSQHVGCKDHFYTTHSQDRPLILDHFSKTQITFRGNTFEWQTFSNHYSCNICPWQMQYGVGFVRFRELKLLTLCYRETMAMENKPSNHKAMNVCLHAFKYLGNHLCRLLHSWHMCCWRPNGV